jgi:hypothetical protein
MLCDQPTPDTATPVTYMGNGLVYNGQVLAPSGPGGVLVLQNSTGLLNQTLDISPVSTTTNSTNSTLREWAWPVG